MEFNDYLHEIFEEGVSSSKWAELVNRLIFEKISSDIFRNGVRARQPADKSLTYNSTRRKLRYRTAMIGKEMERRKLLSAMIN